MFIFSFTLIRASIVQWGGWQFILTARRRQGFRSHGSFLMEPRSGPVLCNVKACLLHDTAKVRSVGCLKMQPTVTVSSAKRRGYFLEGVFHIQEAREEAGMFLPHSFSRGTHVPCQRSNCCDLQGAPGLQNSVIGAPVPQPWRVQLEPCVWGLLRGGVGVNTREIHAAAVSRPRSRPAEASMPRNTLSWLCGCEDSQKEKERLGWKPKQDSPGVYEAFSF